jgi:hypothetical protein
MILFRRSSYSVSKVGIPTAVASVPTVHSSKTGIRLFILLVATFIAAAGFAQKPIAAKKILQRCGTMEAIAKDMENDPALRERMRQGQLDYQRSITGKPNTALGNIINSPANLPGPVTIPIVIHIVLPNPWSISDEAVEFFIKRLNEDFAGINADSANGIAFFPVRGHSLLRFTLAKRDIAGKFTTGIVRVVGITEIGLNNPQPIKNSATATGGSTGWDVSKYYNLYVGDGGAAGLLGIAPAIGPGGAAGSNNADGVCVDYRSFANLCFSYPEFNLGRTAVHEIGHNFGLFHPFDNGCATNDFSQLTSAGCSLPPELLAPADDIPNQSNPTSGCPSPGAANGCTAGIARMFQNFMDYTDDACYSMFSKGSVKRLEWVLENCRSGYLTTLGGQYPDNMPALDAAINSVVSPGGLDFNTANCTSITYPALSCPGEFIPRLRITNAGSNILTSITLTSTINGLSPVTNTVNVTIATGKSAIVALAPQMAVSGANLLKIVLSAPNNGADANAANNEITTSFTVAPLLPLPYTESFQSATFPPANGSSIINPDAPETTWVRTTLAGRPGNASMRINCFNYAADANGKLGQRDIYRLPSINTLPFDSLALSFNVAYRQYPDTKDSLNIIYSTDCGLSWKPVGYSKGGASLSTVTGTITTSFVPANATQWRTERVVLKDFCASNLKNVVLGFESVNDYGNNIYIDSINVVGFTAKAKNAAVISIAQPLSAICTTGFTPTATIVNLGLDTITTIKVSYKIDDGAEITTNWTGKLTKCDNVTISLPAATTTVGTHVISVYTSLPNGAADQFVQNDTLKKAFSVFSTTPSPTPIYEGFEDAQFPRSNWGIYNVNGGTTWESTSESAKSGTKSLVIRNSNSSNSNGALDYFITPIVANSSSFDSLFVDFDLAYRSGVQYPGSTVFPLDTLEILATSDCGATFTSVWKKFGFELQTVNDPNYTFTDVYIPRQKEEWKANRVYLTPYVGSSSFQLYFASKGNKQNSIWLDNINITSQKLPQRLKDQGYLIYPNPFNNTFLIHHSAAEPPVDLQSVQVFNAAGQMVWEKRYNGNAARQIIVDCKALSGGLYILKMIYTNKTIVERIVKR